MSGGGIGGALGTGLGVLLAPETGGASMLIPAGLGALGGAAGSALTGGNALTGGLMGGASGVAGGFLSGLLGGGADAAGDLADGAGAATDSAPLDTTASSLSDVTNPLDMSTAEGTDAGSAGLDNLASEASSPATASLNSISGSSPGVNPATGGSISPSVSGATPPAVTPPSDSSSSWNPLNSLKNVFGGSSNSTDGAYSMANAGKSSLSDYLIPAGLGVSALSMLFPQGSNPVSSGVPAAQASFNAPLTPYTYNSVSTPYTGNWYTYGQRPQGPMVTNTVTPTAAKRGGLMHFAQGGINSNPPIPGRKPTPPSQMPPLRDLSIQDIVNALPKGVIPQQQPQQMSSTMPSAPGNTPAFGGYARGGLRHFAMGGQMPPQMPMGGQPVQPPMAAPPMGAGMPPIGGQRPNPQQQAAQFAIGHRIGQALRGHIKGQGVFSGSGPVHGPGGGQDDQVNAKLGDGEYVHSADVVAAIGDGSSKEGGRKLKAMDAAVRKHKTSHGSKFPPRAKNPLSYIGAR